MIGLVLVSHSRALAEATMELIRAMSGEEVPVAIAAGTGDDHKELGTDAVEISEAISSLSSEEGVVVMMDMGSAVLSTEMALDLLDEPVRSKVRLCPWAFVEGSVVGGVVAKTGGSIEDVIREASQALNQKTEHLADDTSSTEDSPANESTGSESIRLTVHIPHGLHARPAAQLVQLASQFNSVVKLRDLTNGKGPVPLRSITGVMTLEVLYGHEVEITADGPDASVALQKIGQAFAEGLGDTPVEHMPEPAVEPEDNDKPEGISGGIIVAPVYFPAQFSYVFPEEKVEDTTQETGKLETSLEVTCRMLHQKAEDVSAKFGKEKGNIFRAQAAMLDDPALTDRAKQLIREKQMPAPEAWWNAVKEVMEQYKQLQDRNLKQRVLDLEDVAQLVLIQFGIKESDRMNISGKGIIIVDDLTPGQVSSLDKTKIAGVICLENGSTSHSAILLRSRDIPAIVQARRFPQNLRELKEGSLLAMDGETGEIWVNPQDLELDTIRQREQEWSLRKEKQKQESSQPAVTRDGERIAIMANVGSAEEVRLAVANYAEGIGLLRTEFLFLDRQQAPTEEEQVQLMQQMLEPVKGKPVVIRTLDAGGDKSLPYLHMPAEENPFLGIRAIRLLLRNPDIFRQQLRAILRISTEQDVRIMFPMISTLEELRRAKKALEEAHQSLTDEKTAHTWPIPAGIMIEVPSAAILAHLFAPEVDFMSIGTNDLIQYTLAADRTNPALQAMPGNKFDLSVLMLIRHVAESCKDAGISVSVCGESAANPDLALQLVGAGVTGLSMNPVSIPEIKSRIREQSVTELKLKVTELLKP